jgi:hypothetical protein
MFEKIAKIVAQGNTLLSWAITLLGIVILLSPLFAINRIANKRFPAWKKTATGISIGLIALPLSFWLYFQYYVGPIRALAFGFLGLFLLLFHMWPVQSVSISFLLEATDTSKGTWGNFIGSHIVISGVFWATIYGFIGALIDCFIIWRKKKSSTRTT